MGLAVGADSPSLGNARFVGFLGLGAAACIALAVFHLGRESLVARVGPGVLLVTAALAGAFLLGIANPGIRGAAAQADNALFAAVGVIALLGGALAAGSVRVSNATTRWLAAARDPLRIPAVVVVLWGAFGLAAVNLATGSIPLLASNIDATRFAGQGAMFDFLWPWIIGVLEAAALFAVIGLAFKQGDRKVALSVLGVSVVLLTLIAARSFLLLVGLSAVFMLVALGRVGLGKLAVMSAIGLALLGTAGLARVQRSDPTGERRAYLRAQGQDSVIGLITLSASVGPWVFGETREMIPERIPYQKGAFLLRDMRAQFPLHPFGDTMRSDEWVTTEVLQRDPSKIGGSPPTLIGGLYIDFGPLGIIVGSALLGAGLVALFRWARRAGTHGALVLYSYGCAYAALAAYSYISLKPAVITVAAVCFLAHFLERSSPPERSVRYRAVTATSR